jgi:Phage integrase, N-terminal SAM-like domain
MLEDLQIRNYAPATVDAYIRGVAEFAKHFGKSPELLCSEQIREYQLHLIKEKGVSLSSYIQARLRAPISLLQHAASSGRYRTHPIAPV